MDEVEKVVLGIEVLVVVVVVVVGRGVEGRKD
jgi:hypothetical protein